jgi:hypothetical protein
MDIEYDDNAPTTHSTATTLAVTNNHLDFLGATRALTQLSSASAISFYLLDYPRAVNAGNKGP